jgi:hypothetical protein
MRRPPGRACAARDYPPPRLRNTRGPVRPLGKRPRPRAGETGGGGWHASRMAVLARTRARPRTWGLPAVDRVDVALGGVFVLGALFYLWTAGTSTPFTFDDGGVDRYNLLASAFLHLRLAVAHAPAGLLHLTEPYNPAQNAPLVDAGVNDATNLHDDVLYGGSIYFLWGPVPALVLLVPLHVLGLEPSASVTVACFAVVGLGFALGTLRVVLRRLAPVPVWQCVLAAGAVALSTTVPFLLRTPGVTEDTLAGGFCFAMAGVWLLATAVSAGGAPVRRVALASLCFGLAAGSRPPLAALAVALVPVCLALRAAGGVSGRRLVRAAVLPVGVCLVLLAAYNAARYGGDPLEFGSNHQLAGYDPLKTRLASAAFVPPGAWFYGLAPPRPTAVFPFVVLGPQPLSYPPWGTPGGYTTEMTGGLLPMTPILLLLPGLVWIWRRRPAWLGPLAGVLVALAGAAVVILLALSYENFAVTERYEVEFAAPLLLAALAAWLTFSRFTRGWVRRVVRVGGGLLVVWGCATGLAVSFIGYGDYLAVEHPGTYFGLQRLTSPLSAAVGLVVGHPVLAEVLTRNVREYTPVSYTTLDTRSESSFWLGGGEGAHLVIVSPDSRAATLTLEWSPGAEVPPGSGLGGMKVGGPAEEVVLAGPHQPPSTYPVPSGFHPQRLPVRLAAGVNQFELRPVPGTFPLPSAREPGAASVLLVNGLALAG